MIITILHDYCLSRLLLVAKIGQYRLLTKEISHRPNWLIAHPYTIGRFWMYTVWLQIFMV